MVLVLLLYYYYLFVCKPGLDAAIAEKMERAAIDGDASGLLLRTVWRCRDCGKTCRLKSDMSRHIEAAHLGDIHPGITCPHCGKVSKTRNALRNHIYSAHNLKYTGGY